MKHLSTELNACWQCPLMRDGTLQYQGSESRFCYCSVREPLVWQGSVKKELELMVRVAIDDVNKIPDWCPLPDKE